MGCGFSGYFEGPSIIRAFANCCDTRGVGASAHALESPQRGSRAKREGAERAPVSRLDGTDATTAATLMGTRVL